MIYLALAPKSNAGYNAYKAARAEARRTGAKKAVDVTTEYSNERVLFFLLLREKILTSATLVK